MYTLSTLDQLRRRLGLAGSDTADDARLLAALQTAAVEIERAAGRRFCPRRATRPHTVSGAVELPLDDDLLELTGLTNGDGLDIPPADVLLLPEGSPAGMLRLTGGRHFTWRDSPVMAVTISGLWGWHDRWAEAWRDSGDTITTAPLAANAVSLPVTDTDGPNTAGDGPRFQVGHLLKIEDEYLWVLAVNAVSSTLTVRRGAQGTTAVSHTQHTPIFVYQPPADVAALALRRAAWLYKEPDNPAFAPPDLREALAGLRRAGVKA